MKPCVHFVGFRGDEYNRACRIWGEPDFVHIRWDRRSAREIADGDTIVFATGPHDQPHKRYNGPDIKEPLWQADAQDMGFAEQQIESMSL